MPERPNSFSLSTYERMLTYHSAVAAGLEVVLGPDNHAPSSGQVDRCARRLLETARRNQRIAAKLIEAWHRDVAMQADWQSAREANRRTRFAKE